MAKNELLVSNVWRDGVRQGSAQLTVLDSSTYPNYTVTYEEGIFGTRPNLSGLFQGWIYTIKLVPDRIIPGRQLFVRVVNGDASKWGAVKPVDLVDNSYYQVIVYPSYVPALQPYGIDFEIFHDAAMQYPIHKVRASAQGVGSASLTIRPNRSTEPNNVVYAGEEMVIRAEVYGGTQDYLTIPLDLKIGGLPATAANGNVVNDAPTSISLFQGVGSVIVKTKANPNAVDNLWIEGRSGDLVANSTLGKGQPTSPNGHFHYQSGVWDYYLGAGAVRTVEIFSASLVPASPDWDPAAGGLTGLIIPNQFPFTWDVIDGGYGSMRGANNYNAILTSWQHANYDRNSGYTSDPQYIIKGILDAGNGQVASAPGVVREFNGLKIEVLEERVDHATFIPRRVTKYRITNTGLSTKAFKFLFSQMGWLRGNDYHGTRGATIKDNITIDGEYVNRNVQELFDGYIIISG